MCNIYMIQMCAYMYTEEDRKREEIKQLSHASIKSTREANSLKILAGVDTTV